MKNLSKWFGHKSEDEAADQEAETAQTAQLSPPGVPGPEFGLTFSPEGGESKIFTRLPITIGRGAQNDLVLHDEAISVQHARVYYDVRLQQVCILDLDSLNGLWINEQATRRNVLLDDMKIRLGNITLTFRDTGYIHPGV